MTREIKFRAWDNKEKKWLLGYEYPNLGGFSMFGECMLFNEWSSIVNRFILQQKDRTPDDLILMQFTGLKDKKGIDIYEGDIVTIRFWHNNPPSKRPKIKYVDINLSVVFGNGSFHISDSPRIPQYGTRYGKEFEQCEITGNIYQHPNLINQ